MQQANQCAKLLKTVPARSAENHLAAARPWRCRTSCNLAARAFRDAKEPIADERFQQDWEYLASAVAPPALPQEQEIDPFYLFLRHLEWERSEDTSAGWDLIAAAQSPNSDTRAHARSLLASSRHLGRFGSSPVRQVKSIAELEAAAEGEMIVPYGLDIVDNCAECTHANPGFFCDCSNSVLGSLDRVSHKSTLPAGAILFVEGQAPRGLFIICAGKVNLSTTSREGKILILKTAMAGEVLGLSATISTRGYETTAETATACQVCFIDTKHFLELMETHSEMGVHAAHCLSRDYQSAYRDIHDLVLTRSSSGKLARLLLSQSPAQETEQETENETRIESDMTHEEMAQRIGASRETVTRLLSALRRKKLIRMDGAILVIRDRTALEALTT